MKKPFLLTLAIITLANVTIAVTSAASIKSYFTGAATPVSQTTTDVDPTSLDGAVLPESLPLTFENDATYPWQLDNYNNYNRIAATNYDQNSSSELSFTYTSDVETFLGFTWRGEYYKDDFQLQCFIDGELLTECNDSQTDVNFSQKIAAGTHKVTFKYVNLYWANAYIWNLCVQEIKPLDSVLPQLDSGSITLVNDDNYPWIANDSTISSTNDNVALSESSISAVVNVVDPSLFECDVLFNTTDTWTYDSIYFTIDGYDYRTYNSYRGDYSFEEYFSIFLDPGTYNIKLRFVRSNRTSEVANVKFKNINLRSKMTDVTVTEPGSLGDEVMLAVNNKPDDVRLLKVSSGVLNDNDLAFIKTLKKVGYVDLSGASFTSVPREAFFESRNLSGFKLPEGVTTIGRDAFNRTNLYKIDIPSSVTDLGEYTFYDANGLRYINIPEDTKLKKLDNGVFQLTGIEEFVIPNSITELGTGRGTFQECKKLKKIVLSSNLKVIPDNTFYNCRSLKDVVFPDGLEEIGYNAFYQCAMDSVILPLGVKSIGGYAFQTNTHLEYVELPSYLSELSTEFSSCSNVKKIVCRSALPIYVNGTNQPFNGITKENVTLVVPSFAESKYRQANYWSEFGNIQSEEMNLEQWKINGELTLRNEMSIPGTPDIDILPYGALRVYGNQALNIDTLSIEMGYSDNNNNIFSGSFIRKSNAVVTANHISSSLHVNRYNWCFISPAYDVDLTQVKWSQNVGYVFRYYDGKSRADNGVGASWKDVTDGKLVAGQGYILRASDHSMVTFPVPVDKHNQMFVNDDITTALVDYPSTELANKGWNYVGNPYPCYFDVYQMDFTAPITVWDVKNNTYKAVSIIDDNYVLRPFEAFFVQKPDGLDKIIFHKEGRQIDYMINRPVYATNNRSRLLFNISINDDNGVNDVTRLVINEKASLGYELSKDASKFMSHVKEVPQIYTVDANNVYAINERPAAEGEISLGYSTTVAGTYTISAVRADADIILVDKKLSTSVHLSETDYSFYSEGNGMDNSRFVLRFAYDGDVTGIVDAQNDAATVMAVKNGVIIKNASDYQIITLDGKIIKTGRAQQNEINVMLPAGTYIVRMDGNVYKVVVL